MARTALLSTAVLVAGLLAGGAATATPTAAAAGTAAPGQPGAAATWSPGDKDGFGTALPALSSKVWYTLNDGTLSEVYHPRIDTPGSRDTQFVVSDGSTFSDREDTATVHQVRLMDRRALVYRQVNTARSGRYRITKTYVTDPSRSAVLVDVVFESLTGRPYDVYVLHDVGLGLNGNNDQGRSGRGGLLSTDGVQSNAVLASTGFTKTSSGYADRSDGWSDLRDDHRMDWSYTAGARGNVVQLGRTRLTGLAGGRRLTLALGWGNREDDAADTATAALRRGFASARSAYAAGWHRYLAGLGRIPAAAARWRTTYDVSAMVLAASEDKTYRGGFVASPGKPWAWANELQQFPVYHEVWSRDLYQIATALIAMGDRAAARRALDYLWRVQQRPDGSFPQNSRLDGEAVFGGLQLDEVAFPVVLAWHLGRAGPADWRHVRLSADFVVANGPYTPQERWENLAGYSPATIAAEIAGLVCAADIALRNSDAVRARRYLATADRWQRDLEHYTVTTNGPLSRNPYYLRITANGDADTGAQIQIADGGPLVDQRRVVDPSFLDVVRLGVKPATDRAVVSTLPVVDRELRYTTANGPFWHRSSFDGYGEKRDGSQWESVPAGSRLTIGRGWPLLTGERGEYRLARGLGAQAYLDTMARSADDSSHFLAEQVWDHNPPAGADPAFVPGEPTFSATPLAWTHAGFIRLAHAVDAGRPIDTPRVVACRYRTGLCP
ncbi:glycoside hydrolase family 15 protein [Actinoplanes sp. NPDC049548]|uniref:glycoside hydrolase family 15 protein n=1 Tax=Actinoplanes sp. NPDC049548 TaxID=3155152 RepID=UPI00341D2B1A